VRDESTPGAVPRREVCHAKEAYPIDRRREPLPTRVRDTADLPRDFHQALRPGLIELDLALPAGALDIIDGHVRLLLAWTRAINLTAIRDPGEVAVRHVIDSLSAARWLLTGASGRCSTWDRAVASRGSHWRPPCRAPR
jgi:hypothetical protein